MSSDVAPIFIPLNPASLASGLLIAMSSVPSHWSLSFGNSSHCCQGFFLKEESDCIMPFIKPLWDLLAHSIEPKPLSKGHEACLTWPGLLLTSLHPLLPSSQSPTDESWILQAQSCLLILAWLKCSPLPWCLAITFQPPQSTKILTTCQCFQPGVIANPLFLQLWL